MRNNKKIAEIDFYQFLLNGNLTNNIKIEDQDVIYFPFYQKHVSVTGAFKRPSIYELQPSENLADLVNMSGGFNDTAFKERVKIFQFGAAQRQIKDVAEQDFATYLPKNGDSVFADKVNESYANKVFIGGAVTIAGNYELTPQLTLKQLIKKAGGVRESAFLQRGYINRIDKDMQKQLVSFDLIELQKQPALDIVLTKDDSVFIPFIQSLRQANSIEVVGAVNNPGRFEFRNGMRLEDALLLAGGFNNNADNGKIEVLRYTATTKDSLANQVLDSYKLTVSPDLNAGDKAFTLQAKDKIVVSSILNGESIGVVKIGGEVLYPGSYSLTNRQETADQLIKRAGGLTQFGNMAQIKIYRQGVLVGIDLQESDYRVGYNDSIYIPKTEPLVEVTGAVFNQQFVQYNGTGLRYYIAAAGGLTEKAVLNKAYVQYSNGLNKKTKRFLFFRSYPTILPGSKIIVPTTDGTIAKLINSNTVSSILTSITALVSVFVLLKK
jgi:protein involved in polysaccharide export with SLBB domain